jgi:glutaredoxin 2
MVGVAGIILGVSFKPNKLYLTHCSYWILAVRAIFRLYNFEWDVFSLNRDDYKASIHIAFCVFLVQAYGTYFEKNKNTMILT